MSSVHNAFRVHGMGPCALREPECIGTAPLVEGPVLHALAAASLLLKPKGIATEFYGFTGEDTFGSQLRRALLHLPLDLSHFRRYPGPSPRIPRAADATRHDLEPLQFLMERSEAIPDWPDAAFTQATWVWIETPPNAAWCGKVMGILERARRRQAFTGVWLTGNNLSASLYESYLDQWRSLCDLVLVDEAEDFSRHPDVASLGSTQSWIQRVPTCIRLQKQGIEYMSRGGIFGRCEGRLEMPIGWDKGLTMGAFMAHAMHEIFREDDFLRVDVHVDRERLEMQPIHLGVGLEWAALAASLASKTDAGLAAEAEKNQWLKQVNQAWRLRYPERFAIWGGRRETQR
jgi:hypothetical protein